MIKVSHPLRQVSCSDADDSVFFPNDTATDFFSGVSGGLGGEVIPLGMDDDGLPDNVVDGETLIVKRCPRIALVSQQRNHIPCVFRVESICRIEVAAGFFKGTGAVAVLMDMHSIEIGRTLGGNIRKPEYFRLYQDTVIGGDVKFDESA